MQDKIHTHLNCERLSTIFVTKTRGARCGVSFFPFIALTVAEPIALAAIFILLF